MRLKLFLLANALLVVTACAQDDEAFLKKYATTFETASTVPAADFIPEKLLRGSLHLVRPLAENDGLYNTYFIETPDGLDDVTGTAAAIERIREVYALDYLRGLSRSEEFTKAIKKGAEAKLQSAGNLVRDPFGTIRSVPKGASRFFGRIGEGMKGGASRQEEGSALAGITGVTQKKVQLAVKLGINPYTTNQELQHELTRTAQAMAGGGLIVDAATSFASGGAGAALTVVGANQTLQDTLTNTTPEDQRIMNRKKLFAMSVSRANADEFLMHPWYSPWHETITTDALATIGVNPTAFLERACQALTADDAYYFQRLAQVLARYHRTRAPLRSFRVENGVICALDRDGILVVPLSCDYGIWAERAARRAEEFHALAGSSDKIQGLALWVDGKISPHLAENLAARHISVVEDVLSGR